MSVYSEKQINDVWESAIIVIEYSKNEWRKDYAGAWINKNQYGNHDSSHGWDIDHAKPLAKDGADNISNWVPLQWENNLKKSDNYPNFQTGISSEGNKNIIKIQDWNY
jgi:5-methylcytosine-specific restriction endonuclease McrA